MPRTENIGSAGDPSEEPGIATVAVDSGESDPGDGWLLDMTGAGPVEAGAGIKLAVVVITGTVKAGLGIKLAVVITEAGPVIAGAGIKLAVVVITGAGPVMAGAGIKLAVVVITGAVPVMDGAGIKLAVVVITGAGPVETGNPAALVITGALDPIRLAVTVKCRDRLEAPCRLIPGLCIVEMKFENRCHI